MTLANDSVLRGGKEVIVVGEEVWESTVRQTTMWKVSVFGVFLVGIFPHSYWTQRGTVRMRVNTDRKNSEYGHFSRSECFYVEDMFLFKLSNKDIRKVYVDIALLS